MRGIQPTTGIPVRRTTRPINYRHATLRGAVHEERMAKGTCRLRVTPGHPGGIPEHVKGYAPREYESTEPGGRVLRLH